MMRVIILKIGRFLFMVMMSVVPPTRLLATLINVSIILKQISRILAQNDAQRIMKYDFHSSNH